MQYLKKQNTPPIEWNKWFIKASGDRSFDYGLDYQSLTNLAKARQFLIDEQNGLCAYCQQPIKLENSSIEHVIPKEHNKELSTNYYNLVAVCKTQLNDPSTGRFHCDKEKGSRIISPIVFMSDADASADKSNKYFTAHADGSIVSKHNLDGNTKKQVDAFIDTLNLNHEILRGKIKDVLDGLISAYSDINNHQKKSYWEIIYTRILQNKKQPFRQFLLAYIGPKIGIN